MTSLSEWKKPPEWEVECPSGLVGRVRKVRPVDYVQAGILPDVFLSESAHERSERWKSQEAGDPEWTDKVIRAQMRAGIVFPPLDFSDDPRECPEDRVHIDDVDPDDLMALWQAVIRRSGLSGESANALYRFRQRRTADASAPGAGGGAREDGGDVEGASE